MSENYVTIEDFKSGLDVRRLEAASAPGSLQTLQNAVINRGGEIVKAKRWAEHKDLTGKNTKGLAYAGGFLYVFGSDPEPANIPTGVRYQRLQHPDNNANLARVIETKTAQNQIYALVKFSDGSVYSYNNGEIIPDFYVGKVRAAHITLENFLAEVSDTISQDPTATASVSGTNLVITGKNADESFLVTASAVNGGTSDDQAVTVTETQTAGASVPQITTISIGGSFDPGDEFSFSIEDNNYGAVAATGETGQAVQVLKNKMYVGAGSNLLFSPVGNFSQFTDNTVDVTVNAGAGVIDMSAQVANNEDITGLGTYQNRLAIFMRNTTQIWAVSADPDQNEQLQVLPNIGTRAPKTIRSFGDLDVFFLADSGLRSLRARDSSNNATVNDVGTPVDDLLTERMLSLGSDVVEQAAAELEPIDSRYILSLGDVQYVFTFFSTSKISAWSTLESGLTFTDFVVTNGRLFGRAGDKIYQYGGDDNLQFTTDEVVVDMPYITANKPATFKEWIGLDFVLKGKWTVFYNDDPKNPDYYEETATITDTTVNELNNAMQGWGPMFKLRFVHQDDDPTIEAKISKVIAHYNTKGQG